MTLQKFGPFIEPDSESESITVTFSLSANARQQRWQNGGLSARFLNEYWETFFPVHEALPLNKKTGIGYTIRFVANELLENLLKFSDRTSPCPARFSLCFTPDSMRFYVTNSVALETASGFQSFIEELLSEDPDELYVRQMERNALDETGTTSRMGFLTLLTDYQAQLAWEFETRSENPERVTVTTMVEVPIGE